MATRDSREQTTWGNRFRFLIRFLGLTGLLAAAIGGVAIASTLVPLPNNWNDVYETGRIAGQQAFEGTHGLLLQVAAYAALCGVLLAILAVARRSTGGPAARDRRRTLAGTLSTVGMVAAVALLVFVNAYSFTHYERIDYTRDKRFTIPASIADSLRNFRPESPTTIVVLQMHRTSGNATDKRDSYVSEAERKVTEKVKDLVDEFREFGPRFNVAVLDVEAFGYDRQLAELTKDSPELRAAIEASPENSIFFNADKRVQRLAFSEFLPLDKTASKEANGGRANLVLLPQGIESFARRILAVQERRPKVAVAAVHEWLTSNDTAEGREQYSLVGLRKALTENGFDVVDIVLKKGWGDQSKDLEPAAYTKEESQLEAIGGGN